MPDILVGGYVCVVRGICRRGSEEYLASNHKQPLLYLIAQLDSSGSLWCQIKAREYVLSVSSQQLLICIKHL